ncbi:MAG: hypothetical protein AMXMBFR7_10390 [Planctomycetota bacterium]
MKRILVVDDEADVREALTRLLSSHGHTVDEASDGLEALEFLRRDPWVDLVLLDVMMPEMDGFETLRRLRDLGYARIPVIVMTARFSPLDVAHAHDFGAYVFIRKPFETAELLNAIQYVFKESSTTLPSV